jgi:hypothetical protein
MSRPQNRETAAGVFARIRRLGVTLPEVESGTRSDGSPLLKARGCFMAAVASHPSAEPASVVVRMDFEQRRWLLEDAPETYYVTDYYEKYPLVLVRAARVADDALRDLLAVSRTLTLAKARPRRRARC